MRILITGAGGQLGRALTKRLVQTTHELLLTGSREAAPDMAGIRWQQLDITDENAVLVCCKEFRPDVIINGAAYNAVDACESGGSEEEKAMRVNAAGPEYLARAAEELAAKLIHVSTDYVFDGTAAEPYREASPTNPVSVYGRSKEAGERAVLAHCSRAFVVRTAWLFGEGKNFVRTMLRLAETGNPIRVVNDQSGCPTSADELARLLIFLMETEKYGIWHGVCEGSASWYEFAGEIFRMAGKDVDLSPVTSAEYKTAARRPAYSVLEDARLHSETEFRMKHWKEALADYIKGGEQNAERTQ